MWIVFPTLALSSQQETNRWDPTTLFYLSSHRHGDLLYIGFAAAAVEQQPAKSSSVVQDAVDDYLDTQNGLIKRDKDAKLYVYVFPP